MLITVASDVLALCSIFRVIKLKYIKFMVKFPNLLRKSHFQKHHFGEDGQALFQTPPSAIS